MWLPDDPAPYAEVVINNLGGNKMDYYLTRQIEYAADGCDGDTRTSTVTIRLTNTAPDKIIAGLRRQFGRPSSSDSDLGAKRHHADLG